MKKRLFAAAIVAVAVAAVPLRAQEPAAQTPQQKAQQASDAVRQALLEAFRKPRDSSQYVEVRKQLAKLAQMSLSLPPHARPRVNDHGLVANLADHQEQLADRGIALTYIRQAASDANMPSLVTPSGLSHSGVLLLAIRNTIRGTLPAHAGAEIFGQASGSEEELRLGLTAVERALAVLNDPNRSAREKQAAVNAGVRALNDHRAAAARLIEDDLRGSLALGTVIHDWIHAVDGYPPAQPLGGMPIDADAESTPPPSTTAPPETPPAPPSPPPAGTPLPPVTSPPVTSKPNTPPAATPSPTKPTTPGETASNTSSAEPKRHLTENQVLQSLPPRICTAAQLQQYLESHKSPREEFDADKVMKAFLELQRQRFDELAAVLREMRATRLYLSCNPSSPVAWPASTKSVSLRVTVAEGRLESWRRRIAYLVRRLENAELRFSVVDTWLGPGTTFRKVVKLDSQKSREAVFQVDHPSKVAVGVIRSVTLKVQGGDPAASLALRQWVDMTGSLVVNVGLQPAWPTDIAGRWTGSATIVDLEAPGRPEQERQGCLKMFQSMPTSAAFEVQPTSLTAGAMLVGFKPEGSKSGSTKISLKYTYADGRINARGQLARGPAKLEGLMIPNKDGKGWTCTGTWSMTVRPEEGSGLATIKGRLRVSNPNAR